MKLFRMLILASAALLCGVSASARTVNTLIINRVDGKTDRMSMHSELNVRMGDKGEILLVHPQITAAYPRDAVKNMTFGYYNFATGKVYYGDYEQTDEPENAIAAPEVDGVAITIGAEEISVSGFDGTVTLYSLKGEEVMSRRAADGIVTLQVSSLAPGVYVLTAGTTSLKIKI